MNVERAFQIFNLDAKSSPAMIKRRYYDLVAVWHPDRHAQNPRLHELASEKMKEINSAYETIRLYLKNFVIITCPNCGANNKKRSDVNIDYASCSTCGKPLKKPIPRKQRIPCGNLRCAGTIGSNGRCDYCGKTIEEGKSCNASYTLNENGNHAERSFSKSLPIKSRLGTTLLIGFAACASLLVILYAVDRDFLKKSALTPDSPQAAIGAGAEPGVTSLQIERKALISKSSYPSILIDESYYPAFFKGREVKKEDCVKLQHILKTLGYEIKAANGFMCNKTISCLKQYSLDFGYMPGEDFPSCFFRSSSFHYQIALEHRDWLDIYSTNDLENWIEEQPDDCRKQIHELTLDKPDTVVQLLRRYKFEKFRPLPVPLPQTGIIKKNFSGAAGHLKIRTKTESKNYYIKLIDLTKEQEILSAFIRSGSTLSLHIPFGVYELKYAAGHNWHGSECLFGTSTSYAKLPKLITFVEKEGRIGAPTIELIPSQYGKLTTEIVSEYDF